MLTSGFRETLNKWLRGRIAALRGTRSLAYLLDMSRSLRSVRLWRVNNALQRIYSTDTTLAVVTSGRAALAAVLADTTLAVALHPARRFIQRFLR